MNVAVKNFQSLYDVNIEVKGLTVVTGPSDIGKSALVRAIESALFHRSGTDFVSHGEFLSEVYLYSKGDKPFSIVWRKGEELIENKMTAVNEFIVNGSKLAKVGRSQPEEVAQLGFRMVDYDGLKIALQIRRQRGVHLSGRTYAPFILGFSSADAEKVLSRIVRSDLFTVASRNASKDSRSARGRLSLIDEEVTESISRLHVYEDVSSFRDSLNEIAKKSVKLELEIDKLEDVKSLDLELRKRSQVQDILGIDEMPVGVEILKRVGVLAFELESRFRVPSLLDLGDAPDIGIYPKVSELAVSLSKLESDGLDYEVTVKSMDELLAELDEEFKEFDFCPLCGSILKEGHEHEKFRADSS